MDLDKYIRKEGYGAPARIAREAGIHYTALVSIRKGESRPSLDNAMAIVKATGGVVTIEDIHAIPRAAPRPAPKRKRARRRTT